MAFVSTVLVGVAIGDALGAPFEKKLQSDPALLWWDGRYKDSKDHPWNHNLEVGQFTDDTQMTLVLADYILKHPLPAVHFHSILRPKEGEMGDWYRGLAHSYATWCHREHPVTGKARGAGKATKTALQGFLDQGDLCPVASQGTGPIMRASPYALASLSRVDAIFLAKQDALITHMDPVVSPTVDLFVGGLHDLIHCTLDRTPSTKKIFTEALPGKTIPGGKMQKIDVAMDAAFACFARTDSFAAAVQMAVRLGGDTDTVASLTGALAGAWYGLEGIPPEYLAPLEKVDTLLEMEKALRSLGTSGSVGSQG